MKTLISLITFILIVSIGVASFIFFTNGNYQLSGLLTLAGFLSLNGWVYYLVPKRKHVLQ